MEIKIKQVLLGLIVMVVFVSCRNNCRPVPENLAPDAHMVVAEEVIQTGSYTYVRCSSEGREYWAAIARAEVSEGGTYYWSQGTQMNEFTSKELKRTFRSIMFIQDFSAQVITHYEQPAGSASMPASTPSAMPASMPGRQQTAEKPGISVPKARGGMTIAEIYAGSGSLSGKKVRVAGEVVRFSAGIMNRNWVHLQDGTKDKDRFDLTLTTLDSVSVGKVVTFEGVVAVNKDFGAGYVYEVILENSKLLK